jgi:two-component system sensor histidine kinase VicK
MKSSLSIKNRILFATAAILACSYALLFFTSLTTLQRFIGDQAAKDLEYSLKFAKSQFNARQELILEALKIPATTASVQKLFLEADYEELRSSAKLWAKSLDFIEILTVFDSRRNVIARNNLRREPESLITNELLNNVFERKQPIMTTEVVSHDKYCLEVSNSACQSLPENRDVMVQLVLLPVVETSGNVIGVIVTGDNINHNKYLGYMQQKVFGKTVEMLVTQMGDMIASTMADTGGITATLEAGVLQPLKSGYAYNGTTSLNGRNYEMIAEPILNHKGDFVGSIAVALAVERFAGLKNDNYLNLIICGVFSSALILILAYFTAWKFTAPIRRLSKAVKAIAAGDYTVRISESDSLEFASLAETLNTMSEALHERDSLIISQNAELKGINDRHEKRAMERELQFTSESTLQKLIIKSLVDGLIVADDRQMIVEVNPAAENMLGVKASSIIGGPVAKLYERPWLKELEKLIKGGRGEDPSENESVLLVKHKNRSLRFTLTDLMGEKELCSGFLLGIRDVTADGEVDRLKSGFIAKVSHELKTPLTSMKGSLQFILKKGKWLTGVEREMLTVCFRNTERLISLVAGIIELSRIEAGQIHFSMNPLQIGDVVLYAIEDMKGAALIRNISLINDVPMDLPKVYGDYERLMQVLSNLLSNAIKFSPENSVVTLQAVVEKSFLTICVADKGNAIPEEARVSLFSRFQQMGRPEDGEFSGSGLGLAISREIMEKHGGSIYYEPGMDGGNVFAFRLPLNGAIDD